jgi:hypothetical protein
LRIISTRVIIFSSDYYSTLNYVTKVIEWQF